MNEKIGYNYGLTNCIFNYALNQVTLSQTMIFKEMCWSVRLPSRFSQYANAAHSSYSTK